MPSKPQFARRVLRKVVVPLAVLFAVVSVAADSANTVTGVTQTGDSDTGSGERWGRSGGRTLTFSVGNTSAYATLFWGASTAPSAAFDNNVGNAGEVMTLDPSSNFAGGIARWTGTAALPSAFGGSLQVPTRFTMTVTTTGGAPVTVTTNAGGAVAGINVKSVGTFTANLLFEAQVQPGLVGSVGQWVPILDFYDVQDTPVGNPPGSTGPVLTQFSRSFYFTNAASGLTVDQHDLNEIVRFASLAGTASSIKGDTAFLRIDVPNRLGGLEGALQQVSNNVQQLLSNQGGQIPNDLARRGDVQSAKNDLQEMLLILFGLMPCPSEAQQLCDSATLISEVATQASVDEIKQAVNGLVTQTTGLATQAGLQQVLLSLGGLATNANVDEVKLALNGLATQASVNQVRQQLTDVQAALADLQGSMQGSSRLDLQIVEVTEPDSAHRRRWLLRTSSNGAPATAELVTVAAISLEKKKASVVTDVTSMAVVTPLMPGLMEVSVEVSKPNLADLAFQFSVRHVDGANVMNAGILIGDVKK